MKTPHKEISEVGLLFLVCGVNSIIIGIADAYCVGHVLSVHYMLFSVGLFFNYLAYRKFSAGRPAFKSAEWLKVTFHHQIKQNKCQHCIDTPD